MKFRTSNCNLKYLKILTDFLIYEKLAIMFVTFEHDFEIWKKICSSLFDLHQKNSFIVSPKIVRLKWNMQT